MVLRAKRQEDLKELKVEVIIFIPKRKQRWMLGELYGKKKKTQKKLD